MADQGANNFGPLTAEQAEALRKQGINPANSPLDFIGPMGAGAAMGAAGTYGLTRAVDGLLRAGSARTPFWLSGGLGAVYGARQGAEHVMQGAQSRDAEGQNGGFYGESEQQRLARTLMNR